MPEIHSRSTGTGDGGQEALILMGLTALAPGAPGVVPVGMGMPLGPRRVSPRSEANRHSI